MRKIVLAFDSFKGSVGSFEITKTIERAIQEELPGCQIIRFPVADGDEGTTEALCSALHAQMVSCQVRDPFMKPVEVSCDVVNSGTMAITEMASAYGPPLIDSSRRNPVKTTTCGIGEMIADALKHGCRELITGIGGSATNDAGVGTLKALSARFLDSGNGELEPVGENLTEVHQIDISQLDPALRGSKFTIACDISNLFFGGEGTAYVYAPQKGVDSLQVIELDSGLRHYAQVIKEYINMDISQLPGAGAAGEVGDGLLPFLNTKLQSGIEIILRTLRFEEVIRQADPVLTGEGKLDRQTGMRKTLDGILRVGEKCQVPVMALGGAVEATETLNRMGSTAVLPIQPLPVTLEEAMQPEFTKEGIERTVRQVVRIVKQFTK